MFCNNCKEQIADNSVVCPHCNAQLSRGLDATQPIEMPADYQQPIQAPADYQQPIQAPVDYQQPIQAPADYQQPVQAPADYQQPVQAPADYQQPVQAPVDYQQPVQAPVDYQQPVQAPVDYQQPAQAPVAASQKTKSRKDSPENKRAKGYAAIASVLIAFPALLCLVVDYLGAPELIQQWFPEWIPEFLQTGKMYWSAYMIGFFMCLWMVIVLPVLRPKRPALTACLCLGVVSLYMLFLSWVNNNASWYDKFVLPISLMVIISSAIMTILISYRIIKNGHVVTAIGTQIAMLIVATEILFDINFKSEISLRASLVALVVIACGLMLYEAIYYTTRLHKK